VNFARASVNEGSKLFEEFVDSLLKPKHQKRRKKKVGGWKTGRVQDKTAHNRPSAQFLEFSSVDKL
jgi:hypothetical protein